MASLGLEFLVPADERLMTLNTVRIPAGVDDVAVRTDLREKSKHRDRRRHGPACREDLRIGLMGAGATAEHVDVLVAGLEGALKRAGQLQS
jgi:alanine-glyoxylate transaminase/serine-glyoxylate transaminase/serine-pyruvate transaminase